MRLLSVGSLPPEWGGPERGGVATFHASLLTGLLERDEVEIVGVLPPASLERDAPVPVFVRPGGVDRADFYADLLQRIQPDVVVMNHIAHTVGVTHARLESPPPAVGVVHSWHNVTFRSGEEREQARRVTAEALTGMSALAVPSRHGIAEGRRLGFNYPPVVEAIHDPLQPLYMDHAIDVSAAERRGVVYLGGLIERKDPLALLEAAVLLPGADVTFVGDGPLEAELHAGIKRRGLEERVRLAHLPVGEGHLAAIRDLLLGAGVLCLPSRSESFGLAFIEALACGAPVVGFGPTVGEIGNAMGIEIGEPLETGSPTEIAAATERVLDRSWDRLALRQATLAAFGLPHITERYLDLFSRVAALPAERG